MAAQQSFDISTGADLQEVDNAVNQAKKELAQRYDFKGSKASIEFEKAKEPKIVLVADDDFKMTALFDLLQGRLIKRGVPVKNLVVGDNQPAGLSTVRKEILLGRQAYIVFPRVDEGDAQAGIKAVTQEFDRLKKIFSPSKVELLHGRLRPEEKDRVMTAFRSNEIQILLATSVIEVGVDVPNATVMVVESADQFGLAQLHQLRGRIGRGAHESYCILVAEAKTEEARKRLEVLANSNDGFEIAEADMRLRGPGEFLGQNQSGMPSLRFGDLLNDRAIIERARELAARLLQSEGEKK